MEQLMGQLSCLLEKHKSKQEKEYLKSAHKNKSKPEIKHLNSKYKI